MKPIIRVVTPVILFPIAQVQLSRTIMPRSLRAQFCMLGLINLSNICLSVHSSLPLLVDFADVAVHA